MYIYAIICTYKIIFMDVFMPIPEHIRFIARPQNTVVIESGTGKFRYAVRSRAGTKYDSKGRAQPINGPVIGHIIDGEYVPKNTPSVISDDVKPSLLSYGFSALAYSVVDDIKDDLLSVYNYSDACKILAMALLRVIRPRISNTRLKAAYEKSFISKFIPHVSLSKNTVSKFLYALGADIGLMQSFYQRRITRILPKHHIAIDGSLKQNTSVVNDLSAFSRKARVKGCRDVSIIYAYVIETMEPLCSMLVPGNIIDANAYRSFIKYCNLNKGIIVSDKGFPPDKIRQELDIYENLHYITPLKRNDKRIIDLNLLKFDNAIKYENRAVICKKLKVSDSLFLYSYKDIYGSARENSNYVFNALKKGDFDACDYEQKENKSGIIVFESDLDLHLSYVYKTYKDRWLLELMFRRYKNDEYFDVTRVHNDYSVQGLEFVNFIATTITAKILNKLEACDGLKDITYGDLIEDLNAIWRYSTAPDDVLPDVDDGYWLCGLNSSFELLIKLGLCTQKSKSNENVVAKRGRPPKLNKAKPTENKKRGIPRIKPEFVGPKRPRGRPRKDV